ncbi:hypothetical protein PsorP6_017717 [Peronosclerospora sorghi]|uniref:Uncharacterized protein n=1 Tax=Peronosclerospora sorghi TaxID=230839 RepID=A0ACC0WNW8_9STRA|nr:hypothetical protein PsorP6_017717 [Peronosclerospora sorghi]
MANQNHEFYSLMMEQLQQQQYNREFKTEGASMPTYHGRPDESVDEFIFEVKLLMSGKNIDYKRHENQTRVMAMLAINLRSGAASWYHSRVMVDQRPIMDIDEFERVLSAEFIPPDQQQRLRAALRACLQTGHVDDYVARFRKIIAQSPSPRRKSMGELTLVENAGHADQETPVTKGLSRWTSIMLVSSSRPRTCDASRTCASTVVRRVIASHRRVSKTPPGKRLRSADVNRVSVEIVLEKSKESPYQIELIQEIEFDMEEVTDARSVVGPSMCVVEIYIDVAAGQSDSLLFVEARVFGQSVRL